MAGVEKSLEVLQSAKALVINVIEISKDGFSLKDLNNVFKAIQELKDISEAASGVLPEVKELDAAEVGQLAAASYAAVLEIMAAVK